MENEKKVKLEFPFGLLGFEDYKNFEFYESEYKPFMWLVSEDSAISFLVGDPFIFFPEYELDVDDKTLEKIGVTNPSDVIVLSIITIPENGRSLTMNLQGPLVINKNNNKAMQVILSDNRWSTKHILNANSDKGGEIC